MQSMLHVILFAIACIGDALVGASSSGNTITAPTTIITTIITGIHTSQSTKPLTTHPRTSPVISSPSTCPSETVNHIFYTLPQQCPRKNRQPTLAVDQNSASSIIPSVTASDASEISDGPVETTGVPEPTDDTQSQVPAHSTSISVETRIEPSTTASESYHASQTSKEEESDSPLDNVNFLSFEEWKKQNLARAGQAFDDVGRVQTVNSNRPRPGINNALDSLGEESEINIDFAGFGRNPGASVNSKAWETPSTALSADITDDEQPNLAPPTLRSKDAGKTCKERTNYASFDCAATVLKANKECKSASSVLVENKDSYMLNICSASNKFLVVELCNDILVDTIVLANYEFFSSSLRHFRVSVSDRYPAKADKWKDLGTFEARNSREVQAFLVQNPLIWARYIRIEFLTHYGNEYYCPVSLFRVHGTTMLEEFRHQEELARDEEDDATLEVEMIATPAISLSIGAPSLVAPSKSSEDPVSSLLTSVREHPKVDDIVMTYDDGGMHSNAAVVAPAMMDDTTSLAQTQTLSASQERSDPTSTTTTRNSDNTSFEKTAYSSRLGVKSETDPASAEPSLKHTATSSPVPSNSSLSEEAQSLSSPSTVSMEQSNSHSNETSTGHIGSSNTNIDGTAASFRASETESTAHDVPVSQAASTSNKTRSNAPSSPSSQQSQPPTQESFFKSVHKRLQQLESNSTLSLKYIEEQSRILRDAFSLVEKRQVQKTANFLSNLNMTVMSELNGFRQAYDQLFQSTVFELEGQREQNQREMLALSARLSLVADELVWQKRMGILQSTLLLLCLALALFSRSGSSASEIPVMQQVMNRSTTALRVSWESPPNSPSPGSRSPVSLFRRKLWRTNSAPGNVNHTDSDMSRPGSEAGLDVNIEPPTPPTPGSSSPKTLRSEDEAEQDRDSSGEVTDEEKPTPTNYAGPSHRRNKSLGWTGNSVPRTSSPLAMES